jgi:hypothetical protein
VGVARNGITVVLDFMKTYFPSDLNYMKIHESRNAMQQLIASNDIRGMGLLILELYALIKLNNHK